VAHRSIEERYARNTEARAFNAPAQAGVKGTSWNASVTPKPGSIERRATARDKSLTGLVVVNELALPGLRA